MGYYNMYEDILWNEEPMAHSAAHNGTSMAYLYMVYMYILGAHVYEGLHVPLTSKGDGGLGVKFATSPQRISIGKKKKKCLCLYTCLQQLQYIV